MKDDKYFKLKERLKFIEEYFDYKNGTNELLYNN